MPTTTDLDTQSSTTASATDPTSPLAETLDTYFRVKTSCDVAGTMAYFSHDLATYTDATLGWDLDSYETLQSIFEQYMPTWAPPARSYATAILSNEHSALIHMVDTPELFGGELRILAAVDFADDKIVRWVDYWDASPFDVGLYSELRTPVDEFPTDLKDGDVPSRAAPELVATTTALHRAFADGDADAAAALLHTDVVVEDMTLRARIVGRIEAGAYFARALDALPYGRSSLARHVVGGLRGGAFEWTSADGLVGITAIELDDEGLVTRLTSVYDGRQLADDRRSSLSAAVVAR